MEKKVNIYSKQNEPNNEEDLFGQVRKIEMLARVPEELYSVAADVIAFVYRTDSQTGMDARQKKD